MRFFNPVVLRPLPPFEVLLWDGKRVVGTQFFCQICGAWVRMGYENFQLQLCSACRHSPMSREFDVSWLPHTRRLIAKDDIR